MSLCPTCGQMLPKQKVLNAEELLNILTIGSPHREVYRGESGEWWVTYGGGQASYEAVSELLQRNLIHSVYSDCPNDAFHIGKTLDVQATIAERKKHRRAKDASQIYVE
jgi:hypothetical protein